MYDLWTHHMQAQIMTRIQCRTCDWHKKLMQNYIFNCFGIRIVCLLFSEIRWTKK